MKAGAQHRGGVMGVRRTDGGSHVVPPVALIAFVLLAAFAVFKQFSSSKDCVTVTTGDKSSFTTDAVLLDKGYERGSCEREVAFIVTEGMHGSTWLVALLDKHPQVAFAAEQIKDAKKKAQRLLNFGWTQDEVDNFRTDMSLFRRAIRDNLDDLEKKYPCVNGKRVIGFKVHFGHIGNDDLRRAFYEEVIAQKASIVHLTRRNLLDSWISMLVSQGQIDATTTSEANADIAKTALGKWGVRSQEDADAIHELRVSVNATDYLQYRDWMVEQRAALQRLRIQMALPMYELAYEDLVSTRFGPMWRRSLFSYLGVSTHPSALEPVEELTWSSSKHTPCSSRVTNWADVERAFQLDGNSFNELTLCEKDSF